MAVTRVQLLQGNNLLGPVLPGNPVGVTAGTGIFISSSSAASVDASASVFDGLTRTNGAAYNKYIWPNTSGTAVGQQLTQGPADTLTWAKASGIPWTTLGQLIVGTGAGTDTLFNVGTDTSILTADSGTASGLIYSNSVTSAMLAPSGDTLQRPSPAVPGQIRYNTDTNKFEFVAAGGIWEEVASSDPAVSDFVSQTVPTTGSPSAVIPAGDTADRQLVPPPAEGYLRFNTDNQELEVANSSATWDPIGGAKPEDFLSGTRTLYVNSQIGEDTYVSGDYDITVTPVITNQQVTCGYSIQKPFKTIARAAIEVARITGPGSGFDPNAYDRIVIQVAAGDNIIDNSPGGAVTAWVDGAAPTTTEMAAFNAPSGGLILPRGVSVIGEDLRKTIIRPTFVPAATGNQDTGRTSILRATGGSYFFGFTFKDALAVTTSHHLVDCFQFISQTDLQAYYNKIQTAFAFATAETPANPGETEITAPQPPSNPTTATDGVIGSSPYIFNCSIRSLYGLCGIHADGAVPTGFKSMVVAQFTGVSLQKDITCWERYDTAGKTWGTFADYNQYISEDPNNVRMNPNRLSAHIRTLNGGVVQAVSVFAIGQGIHHWAQSGSDVTITNSNSNFGGVAALADGYKPTSFQTDIDWVTELIRVPTNLTDNTNNVTRIYLGTIQSVTATGITLTTPLQDSVVNPGTPSVVGNKGYTLPANSLVWVENYSGNDWFSDFSATAWSTGTPSVLNINTALINQDGNSPGVGAGSPAIGKRVYVRRLLDSRIPPQRRYSLVLTNPSAISRNPLLDYVLQTQVGGAGIAANFGAGETLGLMSSVALDPTPYGTTSATEITFNRRDTPEAWVANTFYRTGEVVLYENKHWLCKKQNQSAVFTPSEWDESYVQMESGYAAPDAPKNTGPVIIFDNDTDPVVASTTLGYNLTTVWSTDPAIYNQYRSSTDFRGLQLFLIALGFSVADANTILTPLPNATRDLDPSSSLYGIAAPSGAANAWANWAMQFRRPTNIRMFNHAWEWSGFLNYTKALPPYQGDLSASNKFTYYFTNKNGGVVYASGFNEEGQGVSPAGLTNLTTGETVQVDVINEDTFELPTTFNNVTFTGNTSILGPTQSTSTVDAASLSAGGSPGLDYVQDRLDAAGGGTFKTFTKGLLTAVNFIYAYAFTIDTQAVTLGNTSFTLPSLGATLYDVDWGDGSIQTGQTSNSLAHTYASPGIYTVKITTTPPNAYRVYFNNVPANDGQVTSVLGSSDGFSFGTSLQNAWDGCNNMSSFGEVDTTSVTTFQSAWRDCTSLTSFPLIDTSSGTNFQSAWQRCVSLTSFPLIDTSLATFLGTAWSDCSSLTSFPPIDTSSVTGSGLQNAWSTCSGLTSFPLIDTSGLTSLNNTWRFCSSLTSFPLIDTSIAIVLNGSWAGCTSLTSFPLISTSSVTNFLNTWNGCSGLTSFPSINTSSGTNFSGTWDGCSSLTSFPLLNTSNGTAFNACWRNCSSLTSFPLIDTSSGTIFANAWSNCGGLTSFPLIDTSGGTNFTDTWNSCTSLTSFPLINTSSATNFTQTWNNCPGLTSFPLINTSNVTNFGRAWRGCTGLTSFPLINTSSGTTLASAWAGCTSLTSFPAIAPTSSTSFNGTWFSCGSLATFPANVFNTTGTLVAMAFDMAFQNCALTALSIENILVSLVTNGQSNITLSLNGGTSAGAATWTPAANAAYATLIGRGWTIARNP